MEVKYLPTETYMGFKSIFPYLKRKYSDIKHLKNFILKHYILKCDDF